MTARAPDTEAGFTLMEVLAALLIFSVSALGLMASVRQSVRLSTEVELKTYGGIVAENIVAQAKSDTGVNVSGGGGSGANFAGLRTSEGEADYLGMDFVWTLERTFPEDTDLMIVDVDVLHEDRVVASRTFFQPRTSVTVVTQ